MITEGYCQNKKAKESLHYHIWWNLKGRRGQKAEGSLLSLRALKEPIMRDHDGVDWEDIALAGALVEGLAEGEKEIERIRKEIEEEQKKDEGKDEEPLK